MHSPPFQHKKEPGESDQSDQERPCGPQARGRLVEDEGTEHQDPKTGGSDQRAEQDRDVPKLMKVHCCNR